MDYHELDEAVTETSHKVGKLHALQDFCNYLVRNGHPKAGDLLYELKVGIIKELEELGIKVF
jgi:hypothetical protein